MSSKKNQGTIARAEAQVHEEPFLAIDSALIAFGQTRGHRSDWETNHYLDVLARAVCRASGMSATRRGGGFQLMLEEPTCQRLGCASLLRLLAQDDEPLIGSRMRGAAPLFDRFAGAKLYSSVNLSEKSQTYEKVDALGRAMREREVAFQSHIDSLTALNALSGFRQELIRLFNDPVVELGIRPFFPTAVTVQTLSEVIAAVQTAFEANDHDVLEHAEQALDRIEVFRNLVHQRPTAYSLSLLGALADKLIDLVAELIHQRGLADPAVIQLGVSEKAYPLSHVGSELLLRLQLVNAGRGVARDVEISLEHDHHFKFSDSIRFLDQCQPGPYYLDFAGEVVAPSETNLVLAKVSWRDPDNSEQSFDREINLRSSGRDIPWASLEYADPYPLEPVTEEHKFVGRDRILRDLEKAALVSSPGNACVLGQKRVGKTSIVRTLERRLEELRPRVFSFIYVEAGDYNAYTAERTISALGELLGARILASDPRLSGIPLPSFDMGLAPLTELTARVNERAPDKRLILALDEFDAMPQQELYGREPIASGLFQTLRSLGGKQNVGVIIVGGERMRLIFNEQGMLLNKFALVPVGDFSPDQVEDYKAMLTEPVRDWLCYDDRALELLFEETGGNPWITKLVAREIFSRAQMNHDPDIRSADVEAAIDITIPKFGAKSFQHYWDDAIRVDEQDVVSAIRKKVLLAIAKGLRGTDRLTEDNVCALARGFGVPDDDVRDVIKGFRERGFLKDTEKLEARVPLFFRWLRDEGTHEIVETMGDGDAIIARHRRQEDLRPKEAELEALVDKWGRTYQGRLIANRQLRDWLSQFGEPYNQRLMLKVLQGLRYYSQMAIRDKLGTLHSLVTRALAASGYTYTLSERQKYRSDILVCGLEGGGAGAASLVGPYRHENGIYKHRAVDPGRIAESLDSADRDIHAVVILEDFIGSGKTCKDRLRILDEMYSARVFAGVEIYLLAIAGYVEGIRCAEQAIAECQMPVKLIVADILTDEDRCFHERSTIFRDSEERSTAKALCEEKGLELVRKFPLGFENTQATLCFEPRCPNNALPVLWQDGKGWRALFPRAPRTTG